MNQKNANRTNHPENMVNANLITSSNNIQKNTTEILSQPWLNMINSKIYEESFADKLITFLESISKYVGKSVITDSFNKFANLSIINYPINSELNIREKFKQLIINLRQEDSKFYFDVLFHVIMKSIVNPEIFNLKDFQFYDDFFFIRDKISINIIGTNFNLYLNDKFQFFLTKSYTNTKDEIIEHEKKLLKEKYSKFIVQIDKKDYDNIGNDISMPYFPYGTLESFISSTNNCELTFFDKIIILIEIATALNDLHANEQYHGNLSPQYIFINSKKDAYLNGFCYDREIENDVTKVKGPFYYRSPELTLQTQNDEINYYLCDIFSFGILMYELFTNKSMFDLMFKMTREQKQDIFKGNYRDFLFKDNNEIFNKSMTDGDGSSLNEIKNIIEKCIKTDINERFQSFKELINKLYELSFVTKNKKAIDFRINNSLSSSEYRCYLSDILECYFHGKTDCLEDIITMIETKNQDKVIFDEKKDDILKLLFKSFNIKASDRSSSFAEIFNYIFQIYYKNLLDQKKYIIDANDPLYLMSVEANNSSKSKHLVDNADIIIPISTLGNFIKNNRDKYSNYSLLWIYFIAKELLQIHSKNLYHGNLSLDTIGLYYNKNTNIFVPSIILYYSFDKKMGNGNNNNNHFDNIENLQKKDLKKFYNIINQIDYEIPKDLYNQMINTNSLIVNIRLLYNYILKNSDDKIKRIINLKQGYSDLKISFIEMISIFDLLRNNQYSFNNIYIDYNNILSYINKSLKNIENNLDNKIEYDLPLIDKFDHGILDSENIEEQFKNIIHKCSEIHAELDLHSNENQIVHANFKIENGKIINKTIITKQSQSKIKIKRNYVLDDYSEPQLKSYIEKIQNVMKKEISRNIEIGGVYKRNAFLIFRRFILSLHPRFYFRINVKIINQKFLTSQDFAVTLKDIKYFMKYVDRKIKEPESIDGKIVIYLGPIEEETEDNNLPGYFNNPQLTNRIFSLLADSFREQYKCDIYDNPRAKRRLCKEIKRVDKELLNNTSATIFIDSLYKGHSFEYTITRPMIEKLSQELESQELESQEKTMIVSNMYFNSIQI